MESYAKCEFCSNTTKLIIKCACGIGYCSEKCKKSDIYYHQKTCDKIGWEGVKV